MNHKLSAINFTEAAYFYKSPSSLVDYSQMQSFSLIKSCIEVLAYYGIKEFTASDIRDFFEELQLVQKKNNKVFIPSPKKVSGVIETCIFPSGSFLYKKDGTYYIEKWNTDGYHAEITHAYENKLL